MEKKKFPAAKLLAWAEKNQPESVEAGASILMTLALVLETKDLLNLVALWRKDRKEASKLPLIALMEDIVRILEEDNKSEAEKENKNTPPNTPKRIIFDRVPHGVVEVGEMVTGEPIYGVNIPNSNMFLFCSEAGQYEVRIAKGEWREELNDGSVYILTPTLRSKLKFGDLFLINKHISSEAGVFVVLDQERACFVTDEMDVIVASDPKPDKEVFKVSKL